MPNEAGRPRDRPTSRANRDYFFLPPSFALVPAFEAGAGCGDGIGISEFHVSRTYSHAPFTRWCTERNFPVSAVAPVESTTEYVPLTQPISPLTSEPVISPLF